jgi:hypothetical protein
VCVCVVCTCMCACVCAYIYVYVCVCVIINVMQWRTGSINLYDWNAYMDKHIVEAEMGDQDRCGQAAGEAWFQQCKWLNSRGRRTVPSVRPGAGK